MVRQYAENGEDSSARAQSIADVAASLSSVSQLMRNVRGRLELMQQHSGGSLESLSVSPRAMSGPGEAPSNSATSNTLTPGRTPRASDAPAGMSSMQPGRGGMSGGPMGSVFGTIPEPSGRWEGAVDKVRTMQRASAKFMAKRGKDQSQSRALQEGAGSGELGL